MTVCSYRRISIFLWKNGCLRGKIIEAKIKTQRKIIKGKRRGDKNGDRLNENRGKREENI